MSTNLSMQDLKPEIIFDIGCQKTGTTSRQINFYSKLSQDNLYYVGKFYRKQSGSNFRLQNLVSSAWKDPSRLGRKATLTLFQQLLKNLALN